MTGKRNTSQRTPPRCKRLPASPVPACPAIGICAAADRRDLRRNPTHNAITAKTAAPAIKGQSTRKAEARRLVPRPPRFPTRGMRLRATGRPIICSFDKEWNRGKDGSLLSRVASTRPPRTRKLDKLATVRPPPREMTGLLVVYSTRPERYTTDEGIHPASRQRRVSDDPPSVAVDGPISPTPAWWRSRSLSSPVGRATLRPRGGVTVVENRTPGVENGLTNAAIADLKRHGLRMTP